MLTRSGGKRIVLICGMLFRKKKRKSHFITPRDRKLKILHSCSVLFWQWQNLSVHMKITEPSGNCFFRYIVEYYLVVHNVTLITALQVQ